MKLWLLICLLWVPTTAFLQEVPAITEQQLENLADENLEDDALLQQLAYFQKHPLNVNTAAAEDFYPLRILSALQVQHLLRHRQLFGKLLSIYELQAIPSFDLGTIRRVLPYVTVAANSTVRETLATRLKGGAHLALLRTSRVLERAKGYDTSLKTYYLGSPDRLLVRYNYQYKNSLYYGLVADKDAGEQFLKGAQRLGFDFYAFHFFARNLGQIKALALGDYVVNLGQGLTQWQTLAFGKSADVMAIKRQAPVLLPYRSAGEFYFNRGAALTLQVGRWQATGFVSVKPFSGNVAMDSTLQFTSFGTSGYHRTRLEVDDRNRIKDFSAGTNLTYNSSGFKLGVNAVAHRFSLPLQKNNEPYNRFAPAGRAHLLTSLDYSYTYRNAHLFGEVATDKAFHRAMVHGALVSIDPRIDVSLLDRQISKEYSAPFGNAFTESTLPGNETGLYTGISIRPRYGWQLAAYADVFYSPFIKYRVSAPSRGHDYLLQLAHQPNRQTDIYLRYRHEQKPLNEGGAVIQFPMANDRQNLRLHFATQLSKTLSVKGRTEISWFTRNQMKEDGFLIYLEGAWLSTVRLKTNLRLQYFETGSYDSRIYAYESDVLFSFSIPAFSGKGVRYYGNLSYDISRKLTAWLRLSQTVYRHQKTIGSGLDEIDGNRKTEFKMQFRYSF